MGAQAPIFRWSIPMYAVSDFADFICELDQLKAVKRQITLL